jgi:hypothetical protein
MPVGPPLTGVSRSCTTAEIDTCMSDASTTSTDITIDVRIASREVIVASSGRLVLECRSSM